MTSKTDPSKILMDIYNRLFNAYGPQQWWPAERRFEMIVGAILTQSTAWTNVAKAIENLKRAEKLSAKDLRELPEADLAELIHPSGYFNVKARKLKAFAEWLGKEYGDNLDELYSLDIPELRKRLLSVYGIGEETADSIILYSAFKPVFVIDAYTRRIFDRIGLEPAANKYRDYQNIFMSALPPDTALFNEYHALLVRLGKETCRKNPLCANCCLNLEGKGDTPGIHKPFPCAGILKTG